MNRTPKYEIRAIIPSTHDPDVRVYHMFEEYPIFQQEYREGLSQEHVLEIMIAQIFKRRISFDRQVSRRKYVGRENIIWESHMQTDAIEMRDNLPDEYGWYRVNHDKGDFDMEEQGQWIILPRMTRERLDN